MNSEEEANKDFAEFREVFAQKLFDGVLNLTALTHAALDGSHDFEDLENHDPTFDEIRELCQETLVLLEKYTDQDERIEHTREVISVLGEIITAIQDKDSKQIIDCTFHLLTYIEINGGKYLMKNFFAENKMASVI